MKCDRAQVLIGVFDELDAPTRRALHEHVTGCRACTAAWVAEDAFRAVVAALPPPPETASDRLAALLAVPRTVDPRWWRWRWLAERVAPLLVAGAVIVGGAGWLVRSRSTDAPPPTVVAPGGVAGGGVDGGADGGVNGGMDGGMDGGVDGGMDGAAGRAGPNTGGAVSLVPPATPVARRAGVAPGGPRHGAAIRATPDRRPGASPGERLVFVVVTPPPVAGAGDAAAVAASPSPPAAPSRENGTGGDRRDRSGGGAPAATATPRPATAPPTVVPSPTVALPWTLVVVVRAVDPAARPSGEVLVAVDAVDEVTGRWSPVAERYSAFDGHGALRAEFVDPDRAPPYVVTVFGLVNVAGFELCDGARPETRIPLAAFGASRSAETVFLLCRIAPDERDDASAGATPTPMS